MKEAWAKTLPILALLAVLPALRTQADEAVTPLRHAHAHNDYRHNRPLQDALDRGFNSVEADVYSRGETLLVGHDERDLQPDRTLRRLYLDPLAERVRQNGGYVVEPNAPFFLFIDIKDDQPTTHGVLSQVLHDFVSLVGTPEDEQKATAAPVTVVISGSSPRQGIVAQGIRLAGADGRLADLDSDLPAAAMPVISDDWGAHFRWNGDGPMPDDEFAHLQRVTTQAHRSGRIVRFWAAPESEAVWAVLLDAGADLINTDQLDRLADFLNRRRVAQDGE